MWTETTMSVGQTLILSVMGLAVVMAVLAILAIAIIIMSKLVGGVAGKKPAAAPARAVAPAKAAAPAAPAAPVIDEPTYAVLIAAASEDSGLPINSFQITSIKELG
ncbi:MAG: OadG family protein [Pygmaiobacter massiliensis]|nr:OadG family protein [Pygmaiobacter massiliensis]